MQLHVINTGFFKLDGGAMFGVVPKSLWQKTNPADVNNMCSWAMRSLLIEHQNRLILMDCGMGNKQDDKFFGHYYLHGNDSLDQSLEKAGFTRNDITDVLLTHLHFDHCGGSIEWNNDHTGFQTTFPNAVYWSTQNHWLWATQPNAREKASFLKENIQPLQESGQLKFIDRTDRISPSPFQDIDIFFADGHTESQMIPLIRHQNATVAFMADLLPSVGHIPLAYVMGYDTRPLLTLDEKKLFLDMAEKEKFVLFLEHDSIHECVRLQSTEKGPRAANAGKLADIL